MDQLIENKRHARKRIIWGVILIAAGGMFMLERIDLLEISGLWHLWPLLMAVAGAVEVLSATRARHVIRGLNQIMIGTWVFACLENLWGFTLGNSWPVLLIGCGMAIAAEGLFAGNKKSDKESLQ